MIMRVFAILSWFFMYWTNISSRTTISAGVVFISVVFWCVYDLPLSSLKDDGVIHHNQLIIIFNTRNKKKLHPCASIFFVISSQVFTEPWSPVLINLHIIAIVYCSILYFYAFLFQYLSSNKFPTHFKEFTISGQFRIVTAQRYCTQLRT